MGVATSSGFEDAIAWIAAACDEQPHWHVSFTVADRDQAVAAAERLGAHVLGQSDTEWTRTALIRDTQSAEFTASQFTPHRAEPTPHRGTDGQAPPHTGGNAARSDPTGAFPSHGPGHSLIKPGA